MCSGMRILLIEDDPLITTTEKTALQMRWPSIEVVTAGDGNSGVKALKEADFNAVILGLMRKMFGEAANINLLRTYVKCLQLRIGDEPPRLILNVSGKGYRMTSG